MPGIIKIKPNQNGEVLIELYGKEFNVTDKVDESGFGKFEAFGETYQFEVIENSIARANRIIKKDK